MCQHTDMYVENLELPAQAVSVTVRDGCGYLPVLLRRRERYSEMVTQLSTTGSATPTVLATMECQTPSDCAGWLALVSRLEPLSTLLSFAQRRSVNFRLTDFRRRELPHGFDEPNPKAPNYYSDKLVPDEMLQGFLEAGMRAWQNGLAPCHLAVRYYLSSYRGAQWLEESLFDLTLALEILAEQHVGSNSAVVADCALFTAVRTAVGSTIGEFAQQLSVDQIEALKMGFGNANRRSFRAKVHALLRDGSLTEYEQDLRTWIDARNDLVHRGCFVRYKMPDSPDARVESFVKPYLNRLRGCLERLLLCQVAADFPLSCAVFSDGDRSTPVSADTQ